MKLTTGITKSDRMKNTLLFLRISVLFLGFFLLANLTPAFAQYQIQNQYWKADIEYVLAQVDVRSVAATGMDNDEWTLFQKYYAQEILNEKYNYLRVTQNDSINIFNREKFVDFMVAKYLGWYYTFKQMNASAPSTNIKNIVNPPSTLVLPDTIMPDPGVAQPPCSNLSFEDGTMNKWKACGAETFSVPAGAVFPGSPAYPWGFLAYNIGCCNNRMKADCYGPTGNYKKAANCYSYLAAVNTPPYKDSYQLRVFNAGDNDSLDPTCPAVYPGMPHSVMVGDYGGAGFGCGILEQKFQVTQSNAAFTYMYAVFLQNPSGHGYSQQPTFQVNFFDQNGDTINGCGSYFVVAGPNYPGWKKISNINYLHSWADSTYEKPWACAFVSLKKYIGQNVTVQFITRDCAQGAHFGYAYVSAKCDSLVIKKSPSGNCQNKQAILTAPTSCGISGYQWTGPCIVGPSNGQSITVSCDGVYSVIMTSAAGGCSDTLSDTVHLASVGGIKTDFTVAGSCGQMTFSDTSNIAGATWNWSFPGGTPSSSTSQNPGTIIYPAGTYTATVIVISAQGCADTVSHVFTVANSPMIANFNSSPVCIGAPTNFHDLSSGPPTTWNWNFGNGNTSTIQNPTSTYSAAGTYTVTLIATAGACGADTVSIPVTVNPLPVASFSNTTVCLNNSSSFTDLSTGNNSVSQWSWNFGDGGSSTQQNPTHVYAAAGTYTATLLVTNNFGCKDSMPLITVVNPLPQPNFKSTPVCLGVQTCFSDLSTVSSGTITAWNWNFGDGSASNLQNPCHTYAAAGTFTVTLSTTSSFNCQNTIALAVTVNPLPTAMFSSTSPCLGYKTNLTNGSISLPADPITSYNWTMTGGTPSSASTQNTSTSYSSGGAHNITLIVTTTSGCIDTIVQQVIVYIPPVAALSGSGSGCAPLCVNNFQDSSSTANGNVTSWHWIFAGGTPSTSSQQNPGTVCYNTPGTYAVSLIVSNTYGCSDTVTSPAQVIAHAGTHADFSVAPNKAPATDPVFNFQELWTPNPGVTNWVWDFGDGSALDSMNANPSHSYSATATANDFYHYSVTLFVQNQYGCWDTVKKTVELVPEFVFYIPNTFTPNGDFTNDMFFGKCRGVKEYNIWLFDRWGNMIWDCHHEGNNTDWDNTGQDGMAAACKWDGVVQSGGMDMNGNSRQFAQEDVYVWKVKLIDIFGKTHDYVGHVNVVR
jgi:gliding motility-associated-like protein